MRQIPLLEVKERQESARKTRPIGRHSRGKGTRHREQSLRLQWRTFAADVMAVRLPKQ